MSVREEAPSTSEHPTGLETVGAPVQQVVTVHLQNIPLLKGVDKATLERLVPVFQFRTVARGGFVLHKGGSGEHLLFLLTGRLQAVDVSEEGREIGLSIIVPWDYFGDLAIIDGVPRSASVVACEASLVAFLPRVQALDLIYNNPLVAERCLLYTSRCV